MSSTSQAMLNQGLFEDQEMSSQMGFYTSPPNWNFSPLGYHQSLRLLSSSNPASTGADITYITSLLGELEAASVQRSSTNIRPWGEVNQYVGSKICSGDVHLAVAAMKMKKVKVRRKVREPRFCFKTLSDVDVLDNGYKWRKYGQKVVKNTLHPSIYSFMKIQQIKGYCPGFSLSLSRPPTSCFNFFFILYGNHMISLNISTP
ncbi:hypothetical protein NE237_030745 [Protea cynaroides]|uniref:WRKY domain-containing protein n=1 Tax=Protea cynaroides TaxID=273540 RepID=A0A9Q0JXK9_9MAGN|nr:hypothetical protein NE237_030745 [Protea cynaroides]